MTLSPLTIRPVSAVLVVQPTPVPWSARQAQMWSIIVLLLLTTRLVVALPAPAPPMRKNTSWIDGRVGRVAAPTRRSGRPAAACCELVVPASNSRPAIFTPSTSATAIALTPLSGMMVA